MPRRARKREFKKPQKKSWLEEASTDAQRTYYEWIAQTYCQAWPRIIPNYDAYKPLNLTGEILKDALIAKNFLKSKENEAE